MKVDKVAVSTRLKIDEDRYLVLIDVDPTPSTNDEFLKVFPKGYHGLFEFDNELDAKQYLIEVNNKLGLGKL